MRTIENLHSVLDCLGARHRSRVIRSSGDARIANVAKCSQDSDDDDDDEKLNDRETFLFNLRNHLRFAS